MLALDLSGETAFDPAAFRQRYQEMLLALAVAPHMDTQFQVETEALVTAWGWDLPVSEAASAWAFGELARLEAYLNPPPADHLATAPRS